MDAQGTRQKYVHPGRRLIQERQSREKGFCVHGWSISIEFDWKSVLDKCIGILHPLLLEFLHKDHVATSKENERVLQEYYVSWDSS